MNHLVKKLSIFLASFLLFISAFIISAHANHALANTLTGKITDSSSNVVYDSQLGDPDSADPTTSISQGSLKIHQ